MFAWLVLHHRILTNARKARLGDPYCSNCRGVEETTLYVLRDCPIASEVWHHLLRGEHCATFFLGNLDQWTDLNLHRHLGQEEDLQWGAVWATTCAMLWRWRNMRVYDPNYVSPYRPWDRVLGVFQLYPNAQHTYSDEGVRPRVWRDIGWRPPEEGWVCLNTDRAAKGAPGLAGCGGIFRDDQGRWVRGFTKHLGLTTAFVAELWGVYEGLKMTRELGLSKLVVHLDSLTVVQSITRNEDGNSAGYMLLKNICDLIGMDWEVWVTHIYREGNRSADILANLGCNPGTQHLEFEQVPPCLRNVLFDDFRGISIPHLVAV